MILTKMTGMTMMDDVNDDYDTNDNDDNTDDEVNNDAVVCLLRMLWGFPCYKATTSKHFSLSQTKHWVMAGLVACNLKKKREGGPSNTHPISIWR